MNKFPDFRLRSFFGQKKSPRGSPIPAPTIPNSPTIKSNDTLTPDDTPAIPSSTTLTLKNTSSTTPDYTPTTPYYTPTASCVGTPYTLPTPPIMPSESEGKKMQQSPFEPNKSKLFDIIDKFRELGINEDISLPQVLRVYPFLSKVTNHSIK